MTEEIAPVLTQFYAANGVLSTAPIEGSIEITESEYNAMLEAVLNGSRVKVANGVVTSGTTKQVTVYSTTDGSPQVIYGDDAMPVGCTALPPALNQKWNGSAWALVGNDAIIEQINALEGSITPRRLREALLGNNGWLSSVNQQIATLRATLTT